MNNALNESQPTATPSRRAGEYLRTFFEEKGLESRIYEVKAPSGMLHMISTDVVVERILSLPHGEERTKVAHMVQRLDFANADFHHFLSHLAGGLAAQHESR